jgi:hypothetical protein
MSALGQKRTRLVLLDHLIGAREHGRRHSEAEGLGCLEIDHQLVLRRRLHRQVRRLSPDDAIEVGTVVGTLRTKSQSGIQQFTRQLTLPFFVRRQADGHDAGDVGGNLNPVLEECTNAAST